jgi:hypothetical protein
MMSRRTSKRVAIVLLAFLGITAIAGYDYIFDRNLPPVPVYNTLDWLADNKAVSREIALPTTA